MTMTENEINWRRGTLRPFESLTSIGAKFCYLNSVKPSDFICFITELGYTFNTQNENSEFSIPYEVGSKYKFSNRSTRALAKMLGEPLKIVRSISLWPLMPYYLDSLAHVTVSKRLRYCPECLKTGYHGIFHQLPWFDQCLIHGIKIHGNWQSKQGHDGLQDGSIGLVGELYKLYFSSSLIWDFRIPASWTNSTKYFRHKNVKDYIKWINGADMQEAGKFDNYLFRYDFAAMQGNGGQQVSDILHCLNMITPGPKRAMACLQPSRIIAMPPIRRYTVSHGNAAAMMNVIGGGGNLAFLDILDLFKIGCQIMNEPSQWQVLAEKNINNMRQMHEQCIKTFRSLKMDSRMRFCEYVFSQFHRSVCFRVGLLNIFEEKWRAPFLAKRGMHKEFESWISNYSQTGHQLNDKGLASPVRSELGSHNVPGLNQVIRITAWKLALPWDEFFDAILESFVLASCWELFEAERDDCIEFDEISLSLQPVLFVKISGKSEIELIMWWRTPLVLPNWESLNETSVCHEAKVKAWRIDCENNLVQELEKLPTLCFIQKKPS
jgi:hypothetical protein